MLRSNIIGIEKGIEIIETAIKLTIANTIKFACNGKEKRNSNRNTPIVIAKI